MKNTANEKANDIILEQQNVKKEYETKAGPTLIINFY